MRKGSGEFGGGSRSCNMNYNGSTDIHVVSLSSLTGVFDITLIHKSNPLTLRCDCCPDVETPLASLLPVCTIKCFDKTPRNAWVKANSHTIHCKCEGTAAN